MSCTRDKRTRACSNVFLSVSPLGKTTHENQKKTSATGFWAGTCITEVCSVPPQSDVAKQVFMSHVELQMLSFILQRSLSITRQKHDGRNMAVQRIAKQNILYCPYNCLFSSTRDRTPAYLLLIVIVVHFFSWC